MIAQTYSPFSRAITHVVFKAHYSFSKAASFLGLGADGIVQVETDNRGLMRADRLDELITLDLEKVVVLMLICLSSII